MKIDMSACILEDKPVLCFNGGEEDKKAYLALKASGIPCTFLSPTADELPVLTFGLRKFVGYSKIEEFIDIWKFNEEESSDFIDFFLGVLKSKDIKTKKSEKNIKNFINFFFGKNMY